MRVGGLWWALDEKHQTQCWREETQSIHQVVVGLDLVKVQILIPVLPSSAPLCLSHPLSSSPVPRKTDLSSLKRRKKRDHSTSSTPRLWFKVAVSFFYLPALLRYLSFSPLPLSLSTQYKVSWLCTKDIFKDISLLLLYWFDSLKEKLELMDRNYFLVQCWVFCPKLQTKWKYLKSE